MEERNAVITDVATSKMRDDQTGDIIDFVNPAGVAIVVNDKVVFVRIVTGNGKVINIIQKKV